MGSERYSLDIKLMVMALVLAVAVMVAFTVNLTRQYEIIVGLKEEIDILREEQQDLSDRLLEFEKIELERAEQEEVSKTPSKSPSEAVYELSDEAVYLAKTVWGEARGCSETQQAAVVWCVLNRVDSNHSYFPDDIISVVTQADQFAGYDPDNPVDDDIYELVLDVLDNWQEEKNGKEGVGRVLPSDYLYFHANSAGTENIFTTGWNTGDIWNGGDAYGET